jgi:hypothetical protein
MMNGVLHPASGKEIQYKYIMLHPTLGPKYKTGFGNQIWPLCQGIRDNQGTNTCFFVELSNIPKDRKVTYGKLVCDHKPNKAEKERAILTVGGHRLDNTDEAEITTFKILLNSTLSTEDAEMIMMDIKNYFLGTFLPIYECMRLPLSIIPDAERAIRSFKDHLIAGLCSTDKYFPMHLWDRILPQAVMTLNMLRTSRINPKLSAATHIFGQYDFNRAPMAPPGTRIIAHETPGRRTLQILHGLHHQNKIKQNSGNSRIFPAKIHLTISIISRFGNSGRSGSHARPITPATDGPILSRRQ